MRILLALALASVTTSLACEIKPEKKRPAQNACVVKSAEASSAIYLPPIGIDIVIPSDDDQEYICETGAAEHVCGDITSLDCRLQSRAVVVGETLDLVVDALWRAEIVEPGFIDLIEEDCSPSPFSALNIVDTVVDGPDGFHRHTIRYAPNQAGECSATFSYESGVDNIDNVGGVVHVRIRSEAVEE